MLDHKSGVTHEVTNQPPPIEPYNVLEADTPLLDALEREGAGWAIEDVRALGELAGSPETREHSERCERNEPILRTHDRYGNRVDEVELDPSWHHLLGTAVERGITSLPWRDPRPGAHVARAGLFQVWSQTNAGMMCPVSMTYAVIPALREEPDVAADWEPLLTKPDYATGALAGMAMTEKQGGSDVRANTTRAEPVGDGHYELWGHKWFCSYPPCDVFLTLAQTEHGLSCFLFESKDPGFRVQRLKEKLGTRSLPSSEVEYSGVRARLVGEEGRGVATIIRMVNHTRLDCMLGSSAGMRWGTVQAIHHARNREAFGKTLAEQPAMQNVLADLAIESEAATATAFRIARSYDEADAAAPFRRFATAVMKYWICKRAPGHANEALEVHGGNGFVEESGLPRLYRDSPLNSIWEGSGNVAALDVLRAMAKEPEGLPAFLAEVNEARGSDKHLDAHLDAIECSIGALGEGDPQWAARGLVEDLALALQASVLVRTAPPAVADAFCAGRLSQGGRAYGTLPQGIDSAAILERALPA
ncbi:MAG: acyl-CoA dehydrogenase family protein [Thermoleophilaceae bacterium]|nr:acyl-CoA dehydrogenase family protein [Thermoleophilaceae bacterium]